MSAAATTSTRKRAEAEVFRRLVMVVFWVTLVLNILIVAGLAFATVQWAKRFDATVTLPNGLVLKRQFDFTRAGRDDMFASDGRTLLARDIEGVCFNDHYIQVLSKERGQGGLYDVLAKRWIFGDQAYRDSGLSSRRGCDGYYTGMLGPGLLYDGMKAPFLPSCSWRNLDREGLADRSWFERPCDEEDWVE